MTDFAESTDWVGVRKFEEDDNVIGGEETAVSNLPLQQLVHRTNYLKTRADQVDAAAAGAASLDARFDELDEQLSGMLYPAAVLQYL